MKFTYPSTLGHIALEYICGYGGYLENCRSGCLFFSAPSGGRCPLEMTLWPWYIYHSGPGILRIPKISSFWKSDQFFCTFRREVPFGNDPWRCPLEMTLWPWYIYHSAPGIMRIPKTSSFFGPTFRREVPFGNDPMTLIYISCTFRREVPFGNDPMTLIYISFWSWYREDSKDIFLLKIGPIFLHLQEGGPTALWNYLTLWGALDIYIILAYLQNPSSGIFFLHLQDSFGNESIYL